MQCTFKGLTNVLVLFTTPRPLLRTEISCNSALAHLGDPPEKGNPITEAQDTASVALECPVNKRSG